MSTTLDTQLTRLGFQQQETGGGCAAYVLPLGRGLELYVTDGEAGLPDDKGPVSLSLMAEAHSEVLTATTYASLDELVSMLSSTLGGAK